MDENQNNESRQPSQQPSYQQQPYQQQPYQQQPYYQQPYYQQPAPVNLPKPGGILGFGIASLSLSFFGVTFGLLCFILSIILFRVFPANIFVGIYLFFAAAGGITGLILGVVARRKAALYEQMGGLPSSMKNTGKNLGVAGFWVGIAACILIGISLTILLGAAMAR